MATNSRQIQQATYTPLRFDWYSDLKKDNANSENIPEKSTNNTFRTLELFGFIKRLKISEAEIAFLAEQSKEKISSTILSNSSKIPYKNIQIDEEKTIKHIRHLLNERKKNINSSDFPKLFKGVEKNKTNKSSKQLEASVLAFRNLLQNTRVDYKKISYEAITRLVNIVNNQHLNELGAIEESLKVSPVGYLHLERMEFTPIDKVKGELIHNIPLAPNEEIYVSKKEWSNNTEEFSKFINDYIEEFSEQGVTEKSELTQAVSTNNNQSFALNTGVAVSGSYGTVRVSSNVGLNINKSSQKTAQSSRNHSSDLTQKASTRTKKDHKISFKTSTNTYEEETTSQKIKNPYDNKAIRIDYYQMLRKWNVNLFRYGVRLTWDLVIPEPGSYLLSKMRELKKLRDQVELSFDDLFVIKLNELNRDNYIEKATEYGVIVNQVPPALKQTISFNHAQNEPTSLKQLFEFQVPDGYEVESATSAFSENHFSATWGYSIKDASNSPATHLWSGGSSWGSNSSPNYSRWNGRQGKLGVYINYWDIKFALLTINLNCITTKETENEWIQKVYSEIKQNYQASYYENRQLLQDKITRLEEELAAEDALSLRKIEREEIMKGILRWLGIHEFDFFPGLIDVEDINVIYEDGLVTDPEVYYSLQGHGEIIKFLHHAIEWENMVYFLYPYFWSSQNSWKFKSEIDHPDFTHKSFLKAGSARVIITIRPEFENAFMQFLISGNIEGLTPTPYVSICEEVQNHAKTNYPGIPAANPENNYRPLLTFKQKKAWDEIQNIIGKLEEFCVTHERYPNQSEGLAVLQDLSTEDLTDPWGRQYQYVQPGNYKDYDIFSFGDETSTNPIMGISINNWSEASLIGTWNEYTPTSALDIDIIEKNLENESNDTESSSDNIIDSLINYINQPGINIIIKIVGIIMIGLLLLRSFGLI